MEDELLINGLGAVEIEDEIGRVLRSRPQMPPAKAAAVAASNLTKKQHKNSILTRAQKFLIANADKLNADVRSNIGNGRWEEFDMYVRRSVTAGNGLQDLLKAGDKAEVGKTSINSNRLDKGTNVAVDKIRVAFAKSATVTDPSKVVYSNTDTATDAAILNGDLVITVGQKPVLRLPLAGFFNIGGSYSAVQGNFDVRTLQRPFLIPEDTAISLAIQLPDGSTLPVANNFLEVRLMGASLVTS